MAHGLKTAEFRHLRHLKPKGGAKVAQTVSEEAGEAMAETPNHGFLRVCACSTLLRKVAQRWRKVVQQGGRCATHRDTPKGVFPSGKWRSPPVRLLGWRKRAEGKQWSPTQSLAHAIFEAGQLDRETLLREFTGYVAENFDEAEFARSFATVHKVFHDWMAM